MRCSFSDIFRRRQLCRVRAADVAALDHALEALAQTVAVMLLSKEENKGKIGLFAGINKARFKRQVIPGDVLKLEAEVTRERMGIAFVNAVASVDGEVALTAEMMFAVEDPKK